MDGPRGGPLVEPFELAPVAWTTGANAASLNQAKGRECAERWCTSLSFVPEAAQNKKSFGFLISSLRT